MSTITFDITCNLLSDKIINHDKPEYKFSISSTHDDNVLKTYIGSLLNEPTNKCNLNKIILEYCINNTDETELNKIIYDALYDHIKVIRSDIQYKINNNTFDIDTFLLIFKILSDRTTVIAKLFKRPYINLIKNLCFYDMILNNQFRMNDKEKYMYDIMSDNIIKTNIVHLKNFHTIAQYFNRLSYALKNKYEPFFNIKLISYFTYDMTNKDYKKCIKRFMTTLNDEIVDLYSDHDFTKINDKIQNITNFVLLILQLFDNNVFLIYYKKYLLGRLYNNNLNEYVEEKILKSFPIGNENHYYTLILNVINDIKSSSVENNGFKKMKLKIVDEKYTDDPELMLSTLKKCNFIRISDYLIDNTPDENIINIPNNISFCIKFQNICKNKLISNLTNEESTYVTHNVHHEKSYCDITIEMNNKITYNICLSLLQYYVMLEIANAQEKPTRNDLCRTLNINKTYMECILESLTASKLVISNNDNTCATYEMNWKYNHYNTRISLLASYYESLQKKGIVKFRPLKSSLDTYKKNMINPSLYDHIF